MVKTSSVTPHYILLYKLTTLQFLIFYYNRLIKTGPFYPLEKLDIFFTQEQLNTNIKTNEEHPPLYYAYNKFELDEPHYVEALLSKGTHTDPLYSSHGCADLLQTLVKGGGRKGAAHLAQHVRNLNHVNVEGETALHLACERGYDDVVAALVSVCLIVVLFVILRFFKG